MNPVVQVDSEQVVVVRGVDRRILSGGDIMVAPGSRTGLIGKNGVGKSALLRIRADLKVPAVAPSNAPRICISGGAYRVLDPGYAVSSDGMRSS